MVYLKRVFLSSFRIFFAKKKKVNFHLIRIKIASQKLNFYSSIVINNKYYYTYLNLESFLGYIIGLRLRGQNSRVIYPMTRNEFSFTKLKPRICSFMLEGEGIFQFRRVEYIMI